MNESKNNPFACGERDQLIFICFAKRWLQNGGAISCMDTDSSPHVYLFFIFPNSVWWMSDRFDTSFGEINRTTQYLRRTDSQLSNHLSSRLSFWLKTTRPCNRNYLELEGNLWFLVSLFLGDGKLEILATWRERKKKNSYSMDIEFVDLWWTAAEAGIYCIHNHF